MGLDGLVGDGFRLAWFAGYLKKDERSLNTSQRDRLLDMLSPRRGSDSMDELDQMQSEADAILRDTLQCFEHGAIQTARRRPSTSRSSNFTTPSPTARRC